MEQQEENVVPRGNNMGLIGLVLVICAITIIINVKEKKRGQINTCAAESVSENSTHTTEKPSDKKMYYLDKFFPKDMGTVSRDELSEILGDINFDDAATISALNDDLSGHWYLRKDYHDSDQWTISLALISSALDDYEGLVDHIESKKPMIQEARVQRKKEEEEHEKHIAPKREYIKQNIDSIGRRVDELLAEGKKLYEKYEYPFDKADECIDNRTSVNVEPSFNLYKLKDDAKAVKALENLCELSTIGEEMVECYRGELSDYNHLVEPDKHIACAYKIRESLRHNNYWAGGSHKKLYIVMEEQKWREFAACEKQDIVRKLCRENSVVPLIKYPLEEEGIVIKERYYDPIGQENYKWEELWGWYHDEDRVEFKLERDYASYDLTGSFVDQLHEDLMTLPKK